MVHRSLLPWSLAAASTVGSVIPMWSLPAVIAHHAGSTYSLCGDSKSAAYAGLSKRCEKILKMQIAAQEATTALDKAIQGRHDKKPSAKETALLKNLAAKQKAIVDETTAAIRFCEAEQLDKLSPILKQFRADLEWVEARLQKSEVGETTQARQARISNALGAMSHILRPL